MKNLLSAIGIIHGRFQPLHLGHMEYLLEGKKRCQFLYVGITNPDPGLTAEHPKKPSRSLSSSNPLTYYERLTILRESLIESGIPRHEFEMIPFPINYPEYLQYYAPMDARFFVTIYDDWGRAKVSLFKSLGLNVDIMWERAMSDRLTSSTEVRNLIAAGKEWQHLVAPATARIIRELKLDEKIKEALYSDKA